MDLLDDYRYFGRCIGRCGLLLAQGLYQADSAVRILATVYSAVVDAEQLYRGAVKAGPQKKAYVLAQLHSLGIKYADSVLGPLIDATVALLNAMGWETGENG